MSASPRPLRVVHVVTRYRRGGSEQRVRDFVAALGDHEHLVVVGDDSDVELAASHLGVPVECEPNLVRAPRFAQDVRAVRALRARLRRDRTDLVVTHQSKAGVVGRVAARLAGGVPVVHSLSMASFGPGYGPTESRVFQVVERALAPLTTRYVVVGADLARRFEVAGIASRKLVIVRSAATLPDPRPDAVPSVPGIPDGRPVVLCLGALEDRKNPLDLVPLLARVRTQIPNAFLAIAGEGPLTDDVEKAVADAGLASDVALLGFVKPVEPLLWRADALVLLSNAEGLPQVLIQAAAAGLPFVTYDVDGGREVVALGAVGRVVPLGDVEAAATALVQILAAPEARHRRVDVSSWDPTVIAASYRSVVADVMGEARAVLVDAPVRRRGRIATFLDTPVPTLLLVIATVLVAFLYPRFGGAQSSKGNDSGGFALTDLVVGAMIVASYVHVLRGDWLARDVWRKIALPILLIVIGSLIGALYSGLKGWTVNALFRDAAAVLTFLCAVDILRRGGERAVRLCYGAVGVAIVLGALQLATSSGNELRASGTFPNPNVAGNLLAIGLICWSGAPFRWSVKLPVMGVAILGVLSAGSFGSLMQLGIGFGYLGLKHIDQAKELVRGRRLFALIPVVLILLAGYVVYTELSPAPAPGSQPATGFNGARFDRSGGLRFSMWQEAIDRLPETPWGAGPGSVRGLTLNSQGPDISNEALQYVVERGVIGLAGLLLLWYALLRLAPAGSAARAIVLAYIFGEIFRETLHYRHLWIFLAIALVSAEIEQRRNPERQWALE